MSSSTMMRGLRIGALVLLTPAMAMAQPKTAAPPSPAKNAAAGAPAKDALVAYIEIDGPLGEQPSPLAWLVGENTPTLRDAVSLLSAAAADDALAAVVVRLIDPALSESKAEEIGRAMDKVRRSTGPGSAKKQVVVFADGLGAPELLLASHADEVVLQAGGGVEFAGLSVQEMYFAGTLALAGVKAEMIQVGDYKGASEALANAAPSPQWDENINGLLDSLYANLRRQVGAGRKLSDAQLDAAMEKAWMGLGDDAKRAGLIDCELDWPDMTEHLEKSLGRGVEWSEDLGAGDEAAGKGGGLDLSNPFSLLSRLTKQPDHTPKRPTIALLHIDGPIIDGDSTGGSLLGEGGVGSRTIRQALSEIEDEDLIKGVILRIDSPGGSAIASEVIWQGVKRLAASRPVWVSVGSESASGGYYCASAGQRIYVNESSIVGSIGVVGGKIALGGLLEKLQVNVVTRSRGPNGGALATMMSPIEPWTDTQRAQVRAKMAQTYDLFTRRVAAGRPGIDLAKTAEGRLFAGRKAVELKLADTVGGLDDCIRDLAKEAGLSEGEYDVMDYPGPKTLIEIAADLLGRLGMSAPGARASARPALLSDLAMSLREAVGPKVWPMVRDQLAALLLLRREPVLLVGPRVIVVR